MALHEEFVRQGRWLFRWRSFLPLALVPLLLVALRGYGQMEQTFGSLAGVAWEGFCLAVSFSGLALRCVTVGFVPAGTSGRNTREQKAAVLNTTGMYSVVRHPLYLANFIITLGVVLFTESLWLVLVVSLLYWIYYERIMFAEEAFLCHRFGEAYRQWATRTPAIIPDPRRFIPPALPFSLRSVLAREYPTFFAIVLGFTAFEHWGDLLAHGRLDADGGWLAFLSAGLTVYVVLRTLKKKTRLLTAEGR